MCKDRLHLLRSCHVASTSELYGSLYRKPLHRWHQITRDNNNTNEQRSPPAYSQFGIKDHERWAIFNRIDGLLGVGLVCVDSVQCWC